MADGYARATGKLGVCLVTSGPGITNALTGIASAHLDEVPLLAISGQVATDRFGLSAIQESTSARGIETTGLTGHATAFSMGVVDPGSFPRIMTHALRAALSHPKAAVHLSVPSNIARQPVPFGAAQHVTGKISVDAPSVASKDIRAAFKILMQAERPLILIGSGAGQALSDMREEFTQFVHRHCIPVVSSLRGKGLYSERDLFGLGVIGTAANPRAEAYLRDGVDVLLVIGSRLGEWTSRSFHPHFKTIKTVIQVDINSGSIGQFLPVALPIIGDAGSFISGLCELGKEASPDVPSSRQTWLDERPAKLTATPATDRETLHPQQVMAELDASLQDDMDFYVDMGNCTGWATHCLHIAPPARIFYPSGLSSMGWTCGAVVGGKVGRPDRIAIALVGDGSFLMNGTEMLTAARHKVGTITIVLNDNFLGMVNHGERAQVSRYSIDDAFYGLGGPDIAQFSKSLGAKAYVATRPGDITRFLSEAIACANRDGQPQVIVAHIDHRVAPPYGDRFKSVAGDA